MPSLRLLGYHLLLYLSASQEHPDKVSSSQRRRKDNSKEFDRISRMFKQNFFQGECQDSKDRKSGCWSSAANQGQINATNERKDGQNVTTNADRPIIHSRSAPLLQNCYQNERDEQRKRKSGVVEEKVCDVSFSNDDDMNTSQEGWSLLLVFLLVFIFLHLSTHLLSVDNTYAPANDVICEFLFSHCQCCHL